LQYIHPNHYGTLKMKWVHFTLINFFSCKAWCQGSTPRPWAPPSIPGRTAPDTRAFPYTETARLATKEIFCLLSCPASTAKKYVLLVCDHGFFLVSLGYVPGGTLLSQVITNFIKTKHPKGGGKQGTKGKDPCPG